MNEELKKIDEENKIPTIEEMKEEALKFANNIPNLKEKHQEMVEIRGNVIELSIIIEMCFNQLITSTGKEMVFDHSKKELYLLKGIRTKKDLPPRFKTKSNDMKKLIEATFPKLDNVSKSNLSDALNRFLAIRNIFAHAPVNWSSNPLEFQNDIAYKHFFKLEPKWKNVFFALNEFTQLHQWIIDAILAYNRHILLKKEILSVIFLRKSQAKVQEEANKLKVEEKNKNETTN